MKKISSKISLAIAVCSCLAVILLGWISVREGIILIRKEEEEKLLWMSRQYAAQFSQDMDVIESKVESISCYVKDTMDYKRLKSEEGYLAEYEQQLAEYLFAFAKDQTMGKAAWCYFNPELSTTPHDVYYVDGDADGIPDRQEYIPLSYYDKTPVENDDKYWWYGPVETRELVWTNPYEWTLINGEVIKVASCAKPVYINDELVAVVGTYYHFDKMNQEIEKIKVYENGYASLFNEKLDTIIHPTFEAGTRYTSDNLMTVMDGVYSGISEKIMQSEYGVVPFENEGEKSLLAYSKLSNGWVMGISPKLSEMYAELYGLIIKLLVALIFCIMVSLVVARYAGKKLAAPILKIVEMAKSIGKGDLKARVFVNTEDETKLLADELNDMAGNLEKLNEDLVQLAYYDSLTGIANKHLFEKRAKDLLQEETRYCYIVFDINKFKLINDIFGLEKGNSLLKHIGTILKENIKENEICARIYADSFHLLLEYNGKQELENRLSKIKEAVYAYKFEFNTDYKLSVGFGIYVIESKVALISSMGDKAKLALDKIKGVHGISTYFYNENIRNQIMEEQEIENKMENALKNNEFEMYLQPKYHIGNEKIVGAEALVRWNNPQTGMISPGEFIPVFEKNGFIAQLDMYMLESVCKFLRKRIDEGLYLFPISINQSRQYINSSDYIRNLVKMVGKHSIPHSLIELEITETAFFENQEEMVKIVKNLHELGFIISMDDFGSGYSSLNMLQDILVDVLKIDRLFFKESINSDRGKKIVSNIIGMASELNMKIVAEGIETQLQVDFLKETRCNIIQGYFFSKPICENEFNKLCEKFAENKQEN